MQAPSDAHDANSHAQSQAFINLSGYRFVEIDNLPELRADMHAAFSAIGIMGTVLIAEEGINAALAGTRNQADQAKQWLDNDHRLASLWLKESESDILPFSKLKVKIRDEIITFQPKQSNRVSPAKTPAPAIEPTAVKQWLNADKPFCLLDTRNTYEIESGTFEKALDLSIDNFRDFPAAVAKAVEDGVIDKSTPMVTFCTGGIRCEKAAPYLIEQGFKEVYQIEGGILNYFDQCGGEHWKGDCFVFDDRVEIDTNLQPTGAARCDNCRRAVNDEHDPCTCESLRQRS